MNLRHVFYALSFPLDRVNGALAKVYSTYALTDEAYAVTSAEPSTWTSRRILLVQLIFQVAWVSGATIGALAGSALPIERIQGVDFALTALFVVLAIDAYRVRPVPTVWRPARAVCAVVAWLLVPGQMLVWAFVGYTALLIGRLGMARRWRRSG